MLGVVVRSREGVGERGGEVGEEGLRILGMGKKVR